MDFKSFNKNYRHSSEQKTAPNGEDIRKKAQSYAGKSDDELLGDIMKTARQGKADGSIDDEQLQKFAESVAPMLNQEQRERLNRVLEMIKRS